MAVALLADCRRAEDPGTGGWNARHMVVIKPGAAERSVYISVLPMGLCGFMEVLCQSLCLQGLCVSLSVCCTVQVYSFAMTSINYGGTRWSGGLQTAVILHLLNDN